MGCIVKFKILSHACMLIQSNRASIIIDPWLLGSCYWRSWWNFPEASFDEEELALVDAVVISHIHWDHWHGPTLKKWFRGKPIYIPDEPGERSGRDLQSIGFDRVVRVPHGKKVMIEDIALTMYQFGLLLNDAAVVVEADGVSLLNANDAKIAGWSLRAILARHGRFNFAFRSHSSANPRICYHLEGSDDYMQDDREHYLRSFAAFMDRVRPEFAIPFASNHCHLHDDVYGLNSYISNPLQLRDFIGSLPTPPAWKLNVMLPGSQWSQGGGFVLRSEACFSNLEDTLADYRISVGGTLQAYTAYENQVLVTHTTFNRFLKLLDVKPVPQSCRGKFIVSVRWPNGRGISMEVSLDTRSFTEVPFTTISSPGLPVMIFPAVVFRDAVAKNMFHHAGISKRCRFAASRSDDMSRLKSVLWVLEKAELGLFPLNRKYLGRVVRTYLRRWRELFVYAHALWLIKVRRKPLYLAEEAILRGEL
jgi:UDP-MurNAc hydroxylase